jgi:hypothetical protein
MMYILEREDIYIARVKGIPYDASAFNETVVLYNQINNINET